MIWRLDLSIARQSHGLFAFCFTKLHISSASASTRRMIISPGRLGSCTCQCSGAASTQVTMRSMSHRTNHTMGLSAEHDLYNTTEPSASRHGILPNGNLTEMCRRGINCYADL